MEDDGGGTYIPVPPETVRLVPGMYGRPDGDVDGVALSDVAQGHLGRIMGEPPAPLKRAPY